MTDHVALTVIIAVMLCLAGDDQPVVNALLFAAVILVGGVPMVGGVR